MDFIKFESYGLRPSSTKPVAIHVTASIYHSDECLCEMKTEEYSYRGVRSVLFALLTVFQGNLPTWNQWLEGVAYKCIPWVNKLDSLHIKQQYIGFHFTYCSLDNHWKKEHCSGVDKLSVDKLQRSHQSRVSVTKTVDN
jgi:hypothetical protein